MTWTGDKLMDELRQTIPLLEDALRLNDLERAQMYTEKGRAIFRHLNDEIFAIRIQQWDDHLKDYVETK